MYINPNDALAKLKKEGKLFVELFKHGKLSVEMYKPNGADLQLPHDRDEIYVITSGTGKFDNNGVVNDVAQGDFLFVPAYAPHRFFDFTPDFAAWVFFYGNVGGEAALEEE
jgi:mannose-6-phosphate isomerase-like protein (cupin superfamily)